MSERLQGKVAVITGGASGMGKSTVARFLAEGASVMFCDLNEDTMAATLAEMQQAGHGDNVAAMRADVSAEDDVAALVDGAVDRFGRLDCMFNNAGFGGAFGPVTELKVEDWDTTFAVLVRGVFLGTKHATRHLKAQGEGGTIISTASIAGLTGGAGPVAYSAAKAAVVNFTNTMCGELSEYRIRINAIAPGAIRTPLLHGNRAQLMEKLAEEKTPWPRLGEGEDIAALMTFLASDESEFITGQTIAVDGGVTGIMPSIWGFGSSSMFTGAAGMGYGSTGKEGELRKVGD